LKKKVHDYIILNSEKGLIHLKQYVVDAFTNSLFHGNPAAVVVLDAWPSDTLLQNITMENNLSETAFTVKDGTHYHLRWFTPGGEIDLCGHATLATSFVLAHFYEPTAKTFIFDTLSGELVVNVNHREQLFELNFPSYSLTPVPITEKLVAALGVTPIEAVMGRDLVVVLENEDQVRHFTPNLAKIATLDGLILHITAKGSAPYDCVSRSFAPKLAVAEDPVCGSGHCHLIPYWSQKLGKTALTAYQASNRGGTLIAKYQGARTSLSGAAVLYASTTLNIAPGDLC
jgi:PhzF family phenazine biosynthesis protein